MPRLFVSHSSKDNVHALAFQRWLEAKGWAKDDVFIDLHGIGAGERWRETLVKANVACEALLYFASPEALDSEECKREVRRAEDDRKEVMVAILRDVKIDDRRLAPYAERQIMDLSVDPREERVEVEHQGRRHLIDFNRPALNAIHTKLIELGIAPDSFVWPPKDKPNAAPYPGLDAFDENSAGIFFGREADIMGGVRELRQIRHRGSPRLLIIQAASGAGKSSFLRAGLWPRLRRTSEFLPLCVVRAAKGILTGPHGIGQGLAAWFSQHGHAKAAGSLHGELLSGDEAAGAAKLAAYLAEAKHILSEERVLGVADGKPPIRLSPLIAIDQGEELFATEDVSQTTRFLGILGRLLSSPSEGLDPFVLVTIRADSVPALLKIVPELRIDTPHTIMLPPLSPAAYRDVITKPAAVYTRQVQRLEIEPELVQALVTDATGADALPLLAFTLLRLFNDFSPEQKLTLAHYEAIGGIGGSIDRALAGAQRQAGTDGTAGHLRQLMVPGLATWDPAAGAAKRLVAREQDLVAGERAPLAPLTHALVEARLLTRGAGTLEVAHEALLRRQPIAAWLEEQKDALKLRDDMLREAQDWERGGRQSEDLVRLWERLQNALALKRRPDFAAAMAPAEPYLEACRRLEKKFRRRTRLAQTLIYTLLLGIIAGLLAFINQEFLKEQYQWRMVMRPSVLSTEQERALKPKDEFKECVNGCPIMIVVPAGKFTMGSPDGEKGRSDNEGPQRDVTIAKSFAIGKYDVTFAEWDTCVAAGACPKVSDNGWGRGNRPVILVSWQEAKGYVTWLRRMTGKDYRLLTEAEWEYSARAGNQGRYSFGDDAAQLGDYAWYPGNSESKTQPVAKKKPNAFGLYDMHGNVWQWVEDCYHKNYRGAPSDGSAWVDDCVGSGRVVRGGSWNYGPVFLRSASRAGNSTVLRDVHLGFRVREDAFSESRRNHGFAGRALGVQGCPR